MAIENYGHKKLKIQIVKSYNLNIISPSQALGFSVDGSTCWLQFGDLNSVANVKNNTKKFRLLKKRLDFNCHFNGHNFSVDLFKP
jgi:hypothetical protein